ncbi:MAG: class I SAM-dependent methyltransferase [Armatimonadetes bacterium]|nr:class I SAM-dependent methyltransferase [Armatimonadota bacterium]
MPESSANNKGVRERFSTEITPLVYDVQWADAPDVAFWVEWCREVGGPVLELGCGNGRVSIPLARAGLQVVGVDLYAPMLAAAHKRQAAEPAEVRQRVRFEQGDMREFDPGIEIGCAIIPANTFSVLLTPEDQERTLACIGSRLKPRGRLAFDLRVFPTDWLKGRHETKPVRRTSADGGVDFTEERVFEFDPDRRIISGTNIYTFHRPEGLGRVVERVSARVLSQAEAEEVLQSSGFVVEAVWGDHDRTPYSADSPQMIFVARAAG